MRYSLGTACLALAASFLAPSLRSQVVISEVEFTSRNNEGQWIELYNMGQGSVDLSKWSIGIEKRSVTGNKQYFFGFPKDTTVESNKFVRIHWMAKVQGNQVCPNKNGIEVFTGDTIYHFLFGLGADSLNGPAGAIGLFDSQVSTEVAQKEHVVDWVQWGSTNWLREGIAIAAGQWETATFAPGVDTSATTVPTLAYDYRTPTTPTSGFDNWFLDDQPTPCADNTGGGAFMSSYGKSCKGNLDVPPTLSGNGIPKRGVGGGTDFEKFKLTASPVTASKGEIGIWLFAAAKGELPFFQCTLYTELATLNVIPMISNGSDAEIRFDAIPTSILPGITLANQAVVASAKGLAFSNGLEYRFGQ